MRKGSNAERELAPDIPAGLELGLRNYWYPVLQSEELTSDKPTGFIALGEALVAFRDAAGKPHVLKDRCPHRGLPLSVGRILDGQLQCILHGLRFGGDGRCALIPWEPDDSPLRNDVSVAAYPTEERGGYIWAFMRDRPEMVPPPLSAEVPEELFDEEHFVHFRLPPEIWHANWLLCIDGGDPFHAVILHSHSQAVEDKTWEKGKVAEPDVPLNERRVKIVETEQGYRGVAVDKTGKPIHHGHFTTGIKGQRYALPCITTTPITPAPGAAPYAARLWQFPIDTNTTRIQRFMSWRARTPDERARAEQTYNEVGLPRMRRVSAEDKMAAEAQGDLVAARSDEYLFWPDRDAILIRRRLKESFLASRDGDRIEVPDGGMVFPV